jgi:hypothetical protein
MTFQRPAIHTTLLVLLATGCVATHSADDASTSDAPVIDASATDAPSPDAARLPDSFVCPDGDGDGETDARCGGPDCDDADRNISSTRTLCASPTSVTRCEGAMRVDAVCDSATPYCDARTNGCVADACGDRVVHSNEQCDDGRDMLSFPCADCRRTCSSSEACGAGFVCRPFLFTDYGRSFLGCAEANASAAPFGSRCAADSECYSGLCSRSDGRCTEAAVEEGPPCAGLHLWSEHVPYTRTGEGGGGFIAPDSVCAFECQHNSECAVGATCVPMVLNLGMMREYFVAGCRLDWARGSVAQGGACAMQHDCTSGVCIFGRCSQLCRDNADCEAGAPNCVAADRANPPAGSTDRWGGTARPAEWGTPFPTVCLP